MIPEGEWLSAEIFAGKLGIRSICVAKKILTQIAEFLPQSYRLSLESYNGEMDTFDFPELEITAETESWEETEGGLQQYREKITVHIVCQDTASSCSHKCKGV